MKDIILPCSLSSKENIEAKFFYWRKDDQQAVFLYDTGFYSNNGQSGQNHQFKGRVSHFKEELKNGNASIVIRKAKLDDRGNYSCIILHQQKTTLIHIKLVVGESA